MKRNKFSHITITPDTLWREICRQNSALLEEAEKTILSMNSYLLDFPLLMAITEENGTILSVWGEKKLQKELEAYQFTKGANWREERMGTNAIGLSLAEGVPVQTQGEENFFEFHRDICLSCAPILDGTEKILGVFVIASLFPDKFRLPLPFAILAADSIQSRICYSELKSQRSGHSIPILRFPSPAKNGSENRIHFSDIYSHCPIMDKTLELARKSVSLDENILFTGESGTGKELIARAIHYASHRKKEPFQFLSAFSIQNPDGGQLLAVQENQFLEKLLEANRGTVYIDEISELSPLSQNLVLRLIQEKRVVPYGDTRSIPVDVRIISSTSIPLPQLVKQKRIRSDLFYRLRGLHIDVPSLRERSDILGLSKHFLKLLDCAEYTLDEKAKRKLLTHLWSGNVRELQGVVLQAAFLAEAGVIRSEHIQLLDDPRTNNENISKMSAKDAEKKAILNAIQESRGNISRASEILGLGRTTLYRKFKEYNIFP